jgi:hypothetical protein
MERRSASDELNPVTIADVISPVPTKPSFIDAWIFANVGYRMGLGSKNIGLFDKIRT